MGERRWTVSKFRERVTPERSVVGGGRVLFVLSKLCSHLLGTSNGDGAGEAQTGGGKELKTKHGIVLVLREFPE